jgi:hypothetical protein
VNMQNTASPAQIHADHSSQKRLGAWTSARVFQVRARRGQVVIDLRSPRIPDGDIEIDLDLDHATVKLLVAEDAVIDHGTWTGQGGGGSSRPITTTPPAPAAGSA